MTLIETGILVTVTGVRAVSVGLPVLTGQVAGLERNAGRDIVTKSIICVPKSRKMDRHPFGGIMAS